LFDMARDFTGFTRDRANLANPWLAWARHTAHCHGEARGWAPRVRGDVDDALVILLSGHAEGEKVSYSEMFPVLRARGLSTERTTEILTLLDLFLDDRRSSFEDWLDRNLDGLTPGIHRDVERWMRTLGDGGPRSQARAETTFWSYLNRTRPLLLDWSTRYDHLREITRDDVLAQLENLHGEQRRKTLIALRSLFTRAKKMGTIFRNPTSRIRVGQQEYGVLQPLHANHIERSVEAATTPAARVIMALASGIYGTVVGAEIDHGRLAQRRATVSGFSGRSLVTGEGWLASAGCRWNF
jgi:hypothetical protein